MQAVNKDTTFLVAERPPSLEVCDEAHIKTFLRNWRQFQIRYQARRPVVAPEVLADVDAKDGDALLRAPVKQTPATATSDLLMSQWINTEIYDRWVRHELSLTRLAATAAADLHSDSDSDVSDSESALAEAMAAISLADVDTRARMATDAGLTAYILREYGPQDLLASWRYYKAIKMASSVDFSSFEAAADYVAEFDAAQIWCSNFPIKKDKLGQTFLNGMHPVSLRDELSLSSTRNYFKLSANFLCRYAELSRMYKEMKVHASGNYSSSVQDSIRDNPHFKKIVQSLPGANLRHSRAPQSGGDTDGRSRPAYKETRTCNFCNRLGHIKQDCNQ